MAKRKRRSKLYKSGDCTLRWERGFAVADFRDASTRKRQRVRLGKFSKGSQKAMDALDEFADKRRAILAHTKSLTVGELWTLWLADRAEDGFDNYIYQWQWVALAPFFANRVPDHLETKDYRRYARERFNLGRSAWTVHNELKRIRACLKWAEDNRHTGRLVKVWVPSQGEHRDRVLTVAEARALVGAAAKGDFHIFVFVVIAFATGARHKAILELTWNRVDFVAGTISFDERLPRDPMSKSWQKGRATVPMNRTVRETLELAYRGRRTDYVIEHGGRPLRSIKAGFANAVERAGLKGKVSPHTIRHTVATWLDEAGVETKRTSQLVGHAPGSPITASVYTHAKPDVLFDAVKVLDEPFAPLTKIAHEPMGEEEEKAKRPARLSRGDKLHPAQRARRKGASP